jgi:prepilin-type N-terminal cleavage/methylation domain-containing protein
LRVIRYLIDRCLRAPHKNSQKGFTFIEVVMVVSILGTLAAVTALGTEQYMGDHGKTAALAVEKRIIASAATAHLKDGGSLPVTDYELYRERYITSKSTLADYTVDTDGNIIQIPK